MSSGEFKTQKTETRKKTVIQKKIVVLVLTAAAVVLCALAVKGNLKKSAVLEGEALQLYPDSFAGSKNCEYDGKSGTFRQTGEDPQLHFTGMDREIGGVRLELSEASEEERSFQVFWSDGDAFGEKQFSNGVILPGETSGAVDIRKGRWSHLRVDMDGDFGLEGVFTAPGARVRYYLSQEGIMKSLKSCFLIILVFALAQAAHLDGLRKSDRYLSGLFGQNGGRDKVYDYLRILAAILVITGHVLQSDIERVPEGGGKYALMSLVFVFCAGCNPIYVMLSGALLLPWKEEKTGTFYYRRAMKVLLPMAVYFAVYLYLNRVVTEISWSSVRLFFGRLISGYTPEAPHYWLIYTLLSLYVAAPFFRRMLKNMDYNKLTGMAAVIFSMMALATYLPMLLGNFPITTFLASWPGAMLLGYWITRPETRRYDRLLMAAGVLGAAATAALVFIRTDYKESAVNCSFSMILMVCGIFAFCLRFRRLFSRGGRCLMFLSRYSYSIILIHWAVLFFFTKDKLHIYADMAKVAGGTALAAAITLAASALAAFVLDNTVVAAAEMMVKLICEKTAGRRRT